MGYDPANYWIEISSIAVLENKTLFASSNVAY
jgi:hypothetical protein